MLIGFQFYYDKATGKIVQAINERAGDVINTSFDDDCITFPHLKDLPYENLGFLEIPFDSRTEEILNMKEWYIENELLIIIPMEGVSE